jgi:hypothetical protein
MGVEETDQNELNSVEVAAHLPLPESTSTILMQPIGSSASSEMPITDDQEDKHSSSLPPVDQGFGAWSFVSNQILSI